MPLLNMLVEMCQDTAQHNTHLHEPVLHTLDASAHNVRLAANPIHILQDFRGLVNVQVFSMQLMDM